MSGAHMARAAELLAACKKAVEEVYKVSKQLGTLLYAGGVHFVVCNPEGELVEDGVKHGVSLSVLGLR